MAMINTRSNPFGAHRNPFIAKKLAEDQAQREIPVTKRIDSLIAEVAETKIKNPNYKMPFQPGSYADRAYSLQQELNKARIYAGDSVIKKATEQKYDMKLQEIVNLSRRS